MEENLDYNIEGLRKRLRVNDLHFEFLSDNSDYSSIIYAISTL